MARRNSIRTVPVAVAILILLVLGARSVRADWQQLTGCQLVDSHYNDGDSFHVKHNGREYIFRLCYVDTPETKALREFTERTTDQAKYFGINKTTLFELAAQASALTKQELKRPFTVWTDWTDAKGNSQLPRYFAVIQTPDHDLAELLVKRGLSRVYGYSPSRPDGESVADYRKKLKALEAAAFEKKEGAWAVTKRKSPPKYAPVSPKKDSPPQDLKPTPASSANELPAI